MDIHELKQFESVYQPSKEIAFCWGVKKYVQLSVEENHTEIVDHANDSLRIWQAAKAHEAKKLEGCVVVPESELKDIFYWPDSEYVVDCPFDYDFELDKGEIQAIEKWQRTKSTKIYFANIYKDDESFEITEFKSLEEAQDAVKENNAYLEAQEFFNLAEAARGGNE